MIRSLSDLSATSRDEADLLIDVRSPGEFAIDHLPGAINLPVLNDEERARVGTIYVQESHFRARRLGAALVAANVARHLQQPALCRQPADFRPLIYCWRGGMRSGAMATIFDQIGWQTTLIDGGYRRWRRLVVGSLYEETSMSLPIVLLDGSTGTGKTQLLQQLQARGHQVLDLEGMARHRGSLFGAMPGGQPSQKLFESRLFDWLQRRDAGRLILAEAESSRVGNITLPPLLWAAMQQAPRIELRADADWRVRHILGEYGQIAADPEALCDAIGRLPTHHNRNDRARWLQWAQTGMLAPLVRELIAAHYDPAYARSRSRHDQAIIGRIDVADGLDVVGEVEKLLAGISASAGPAAGQ